MVFSAVSPLRKAQCVCVRPRVRHRCNGPAGFRLLATSEHVASRVPSPGQLHTCLHQSLGSCTTVGSFRFDVGSCRSPCFGPSPKLMLNFRFLAVRFRLLSVPVFCGKPEADAQSSVPVCLASVGVGPRVVRQALGRCTTVGSCRFDFGCCRSPCFAPSPRPMHNFRFLSVTFRLFSVAPKAALLETGLRRMALSVATPPFGL